MINIVEVKREFKDELLIEDLVKVKVSPVELYKVREDWRILIRVLNSLLIKGPKFTQKLSLKEFVKYEEVLAKIFL